MKRLTPGVEAKRPIELEYLENLRRAEEAAMKKAAVKKAKRSGGAA